MRLLVILLAFSLTAAADTIESFSFVASGFVENAPECCSGTFSIDMNTLEVKSIDLTILDHKFLTSEVVLGGSPGFFLLGSPDLIPGTDGFQFAFETRDLVLGVDQQAIGFVFTAKGFPDMYFGDAGSDITLAAVVPEPSTLIFFAIGLLAMFLMNRYSLVRYPVNAHAGRCRG